MLCELYTDLNRMVNSKQNVCDWCKTVAAGC